MDPPEPTNLARTVKLSKAGCKQHTLWDTAIPNRRLSHHCEPNTNGSWGELGSTRVTYCLIVVGKANQHQPNSCQKQFTGGRIALGSQLKGTVCHGWATWGCWPCCVHSQGPSREEWWHLVHILPYMQSKVRAYEWRCPQSQWVPCLSWLNLENSADIPRALFPGWGYIWSNSQEKPSWPDCTHSILWRDLVTACHKYLHKVYTQ